MCRKRTLGEVAGERIVCDENFACLTILAPALSDRAISGGKHMIFQHINNIHLARLDLNEPVCISLYQRLLSSLTTFPNLVMSRRTIRGTPTSAAVPGVRRHGSSRPFYSGRRLSHFHVSFFRHSYIITTRQVPSGTNRPPAVVHG